jgi:integrase
MRRSAASAGATVGRGKAAIAASTREKYITYLDNHILPRWKDVRLAQMKTKDIQDWLFATFTSWYAMSDARNIMSAIFTKAQEWELLPDSFANPMRRVKVGKKFTMRPDRILTEDETVRVLARLEEPNLLVTETCITTGTRISEVLGLQRKHVDLEAGTIFIEQRFWRGDLDAPKTRKSKRVLALGDLVARYKAKAAEEGADPEKFVFTRN